MLYAESHAKRVIFRGALYYTIYYANGDVIGPTLVTALDPVFEGIAAGGGSFVIGVSGGEPIDAVLLEMVSGKIKIPVIEFTEDIRNIIDPVYLDLTATITDTDGDTASSQFSIDLESDDDPLAGPDIVLNDHEERIGGTDDQADVFNIDLALGHDQWVVQNFELADDTLVLLNPFDDISVAATDGDDVITIGSTTITLENGTDEIMASDIVIAFGDRIIDGNLFIDAVAGGHTFIGTPNDDALIGKDGADTLTGGLGADSFVFNALEPSVDADTIMDFNSAQGDRIVVSASGFGGGLTGGVLSADQFKLSTEMLDANDRFIFDNTGADGLLYFDADGSGVAEGAVLIAILDGTTSLTFEDIFVIA